MKQEYSYGAVVYRVMNQSLEILIEYMSQGHVSLPKGHIEKGETPLECAVREIKEETSLDVEVDTSFSHTISYYPVYGVKKDVTFFVAKPISTHIKPQLEEVSRIEWQTPVRALELLSHASDKEVLRDALTYIKEKEGLR